MKRYWFVSLLFVLVLAAPGAAQVPTVQNPTLVVFTPSLDHANITSYQVIIMQGALVVQTLDIGKPAPCVSGCPVSVLGGEAFAAINVQPISFGSYTVLMRAVASGIIGPASLPTDVWERAPGPPGGKPKMQ